MAFIDIPVSTLSIHERIAEDFIGVFGVNCTLVYPSLPADCPNCDGFNYVSGGMISFPNGSICPVCNGQKLIYNETSETIKLLVYYDIKQFVSIGSLVMNLPAGTIQTRSLISTMPKIQQCSYMKVHSTVDGYGEMRYEKMSTPTPYGARLKTEIVTLWKKSQ